MPAEHNLWISVPVGAMQPTERNRAWRDKRLFYLTPQVICNDLSRNICPAAAIKCLVIDEAHKALGNHAYCQVVRELVKVDYSVLLLCTQTNLIIMLFLIIRSLSLIHQCPYVLSTCI